MFKKCTPLWREAHFEVKSGLGALFQVRIWFCAVSAKDSAPSQEREKCHSFVALTKNVGEGGTFEEDLQRYISRGRRSTRDMFIRDVRRSGRWFPERGYILEHEICSFAKMILRHRCSTSYDLASIFRGRRSTLDRWSGKIANRIGTRPSALHSTFHFWRKSRRIVSFLMLSTPKIKEVSQNCFVIDVVKFENMKRSRRIVSFLILSILKNDEASQISKWNIEEVSQKSFVLDVVNFESWRSFAELLRF